MGLSLSHQVKPREFGYVHPVHYDVLTEDIKLHRSSQRSIHLRVYCPLPKNHSLSATKYPIIIFSHGLFASKSDYTCIGRFLASCGYVSVHPEYTDSIVHSIKNLDILSIFRSTSSPSPSSSNRPFNSLGTSIRATVYRKIFGALHEEEKWIERAADLKFVVDELEGQIPRLIPALNARLDTTSIGLIGHSLGSYTSCLLAGATISVPPSAWLQSSDRNAASPVAPILSVAPALPTSPSYASFLSHVSSTASLPQVDDEYDEGHPQLSSPQPEPEAVAAETGPSLEMKSQVSQAISVGFFNSNAQEVDEQTMQALMSELQHSTILSESSFSSSASSSSSAAVSSVSAQIASAASIIQTEMEEMRFAPPELPSPLPSTSIRSTLPQPLPATEAQGFTVSPSTGNLRLSFHDPRIKAVCLLSPQGPGFLGLDEHSWNEVKVPLLAATGRLDAIYRKPVEWISQPFFRCSSTDSFLLFLESADHDFGSISNPLAQLFGYAREPDIADWLRMTILAFLDTYIRDSPSTDGEGKQWLQSDSLERMSNGQARLFTKNR